MDHADGFIFGTLGDETSRAEYERARNHKWYMTSRLICINDVYSFDPNMKVNLDPFVDIIGRNFRQPEEGDWDAVGNDMIELAKKSGACGFPSTIHWPPFPPTVARAPGRR